MCWRARSRLADLAAMLLVFQMMMSMNRSRPCAASASRGDHEFLCRNRRVFEVSSTVNADGEIVREAKAATDPMTVMSGSVCVGCR
jgi:hypothetical protein